MHGLVVALALSLCILLPEAASADSASGLQLRHTSGRPLIKTGLPELLQRFGISFIAKARAAECTAEGETCTSDEQCCPGLECAGGPPATCSTED
jgi:hypothetical protein